MCRFVYYQGPPIYLSALLTEPEHSLIRQSVHAHMRKEPLNGDGFGVAWYTGPARGPEHMLEAPTGEVAGGAVDEVGGTHAVEAPAADQPVPREPREIPSRDLGRFRSIKPAWSNRNLKDLSAVIRSSRVLAHVRAASPGSVVSEMNSHPFRFDSLSFMHNGDIGGFARIRRSLLERLSDDVFGRILGSTDSEHFFALFRDELAAEGDPSDGNAMARAFRRALDTVLELRAAHAPDAPMHLNVVATDGSTTLVSRFTTEDPEKSQSLFMKRGSRYECVDGVCKMVDTERSGAVLVSSEPLSSDPGWEAVPAGTLLLVDAQASVRTETI